EQRGARAEVVDRLARGLVADPTRRHRLGQDDRLLQRQHRQARRQLLPELLRALLLLRADGDLVLGLAQRPAPGSRTSTGAETWARPCATGSSTLKRPRS